MKYLITILLLISTAKAQEVCPPPPKIEFWEVQKSFIAEPPPIFNSKLDASTTIYFDFDGATVQQISWNGGLQIICLESGMTTVNMLAALNQASEDYRPFDVNITTEESKFLAAPVNKRVKMVVTPTNYFRPGVGGVAYLQAFGDQGYPVAGFVFSGILGYLPKYVGEAMSHESGHTVGLNHQSTYDANCVKTQEYNSGMGVGKEIDWAPVMGVSYYFNNTTFTKGPNSLGCLVIVSEKDTIRKYLPYRAAENNLIRFDQPTVINIPIPQQSVLTLRATSLGNPDIQMQLGTNIWNHPDSLGASGFVTLNPGNYSLSLTGAGNVFNRNIGSGGGFTLTQIIEPIVVVANRTDSQYRTRRTERWQYTVWTMYGQKVKENYGELGKSTDNLPPATYIIKFGPYTNQILKQ